MNLNTNVLHRYWLEQRRNKTTGPPSPMHPIHIRKDQIPRLNLGVSHIEQKVTDADGKNMNIRNATTPAVDKAKSHQKEVADASACLNIDDLRT